MESTMISCRRATELMSQRLDTPLSRWQRLVLRFHLMMCSACRRFDQHMLNLRAFSQRFQQAPLPQQAAEESAPESGDENNSI